MSKVNIKRELMFPWQIKLKALEKIAEGQLLKTLLFNYVCMRTVKE